MNPPNQRLPEATGWQGGWLRQPAGSASGRLVIKLGGSLLRIPGWPAAVRRLLAAEAARHQTIGLVVGGGPLVDGLRQLDQAEPQPAKRMHRLAIAAMGLTAELVAGQLDCPLVTELTGSEKYRRPPFSPKANQPVVLDVSRSPGCQPAIAALPCSWAVTSDSIAAAVAGGLAAELLVVKTIPPPGRTIAELTAAGWVDGHFPVASCRLTAIRWAAPATTSLPAEAGLGP